MSKSHPTQPDSRTRLLQSALCIIRQRGYTATTVEDLCDAAGVTKGSFFHHFQSKDHLALAAIEYWNDFAGSVFAAAPYQNVSDPRRKLLGYIDFRRELIVGETAEFTCLLGTMAQEVFLSHPALAAAAGEGIERHVATLVPIVEAAKKQCAPRARWKAEGLARHLQTVLQGAFIMAKAGGGAPVARESVAHLRRYVETLLPAAPARRNRT